MAKLIMCKGLPASGKSTWADAQPEPVVSKDYLRTMFKGEKRVLQMRDELISSFLKNGQSVICDDTNLNPIHEKRLREIAAQYNAEFEVRIFPIDVEEAIRRDKGRKNPVGAMAIRYHYNRWLRTANPV